MILSTAEMEPLIVGKNRRPDRDDRIFCELIYTEAFIHFVVRIIFAVLKHNY